MGAPTASTEIVHTLPPPVPPTTNIIHHDAEQGKTTVLKGPKNGKAPTISPEAKHEAEEKLRNIFVIQDKKVEKPPLPPAQTIQEVIKRKQSETKEIVKQKQKEAKQEIDAIVRKSKDAQGADKATQG